MTILILGSTGMLGQALMREAKNRNVAATGVARSYADICLDITDSIALVAALKRTRPNIIINAAAITSLAFCEKDPCSAYLVNARSVGVLAEVARDSKAYLIQISTDHYFTKDRDAKHDEASPIRLVNEYARTKYAGEKFALTCPGAIVIRTNIVGFRQKKEQPTFVEWILQSLERKAPMTLYSDFYTSSISVSQFSQALFDLIDKRPAGVLNLACSEVSSKKVFIEQIAFRLGYDLCSAKDGSVAELTDAIRAESLGLYVARAENVLGYKLPSMSQVVDAIIHEFKEISK